MATFTNQATLAYNNTITNSNIVVGEITSVLTATKAALSSTYNQDGTATFVLSIINSGASAFNDLTITDDLGGYSFNGGTLYPITYVAGSLRFYIDGVAQPNPTVQAGPPLVITGVNIPAGANAIIIYQANVNSFAPLGDDGSITNTVNITGSGLNEAVSADATIMANQAPNLSITKALSPTTVPENGQLTYTFTILNTGTAPVTLDDNARLTDTFSPVLSNITVRFNDQPWSPTTNYTYDQTTGEFATVAGQIVVPAATVAQNPDTGAWVITPGMSTLTVTGTI